MPNWLLFIVPSCIWGSTWLVIKYQYGVVAPEVSVAYRFGFAGAMLFAWCVARRESLRFDYKNHITFALLGMVQFALNYVFVYLAEQYLTSGLVAVVFVLMVLWNLLGAHLLFGQVLGPRLILGACCGLAGVALVFWPELAQVRRDLVLVKGLVLAVLGTLGASAGNLLSQRLYARGTRVLPSTAWSMFYGSVLVALYCAVRGIPFSRDSSIAYLSSLAYLSIFGSVIAFAGYLTLLGRIGAGRAGYTAAVIPVLAMIISTVFEDYVWSAPAIVGMVLVLAGNFLVLRNRA